MTMPLRSVLDCGGARRITNLAAATAAGEPVVYEQLNSAIEGVSWKDAVRVMSTANITISAPGATIDGITMAVGDRFGAKDQTSAPENGIYIWNGAATPATRASDASTFAELEAAKVDVEEGTANGGTSWRQTQVNGVIGTNNIVWTSAQTSAPAASESTAGVAEIATQAETDTGTDDARILTPLKAKTASWAHKRYAANHGDGSATSIAVTHNLNSLNVHCTVWETTGDLREVMVEKRRTSVNVITLVFDTGAAPATNGIHVVISL